MNNEIENYSITNIKEPTKKEFKKLIENALDAIEQDKKDKIKIIPKMNRFDKNYIIPICSV